MFRHLLARSRLLLPLLLAASWASAAPAYPKDPFADDRLLLPAKEIGTARGQTRLTVLGALAHSKASPDDFYFGGKGTVEFMLHEFGAVRLSGYQDMVEKDMDRLASRATSLRVGPALHLSPYHRVDLGPYLEGGALLHNLGREDAAVAPEVAIGGFITIHIDSYWYVQLELERAFARVEVDNDFVSRNRTAAFLGLGLGF